MRDLVRDAFSVIAIAAFLADCGGSPGAIPQSGAVAANAERDASRLSSGANGYLIYAYGDDGYALDFFTYGQGRLVGAIGGFSLPNGMCSDAKGDVWILDTGDEKIVEYAHGETKQIASLRDAGEGTADCSVDPTTGNLAVTNLYSDYRSKESSLAIYTHAKGSPKIYRCRNIERYYFVGYDSKGNLFVDGENAANKFGFCGLYKGSHALLEITLDHHIGIPGPVRWDGTYVAVGAQLFADIYRFKIAGNRGKRMGTVHLEGSTIDIVDFAFVPFHGHVTKLLAETYQWGGLGVWNYPAGGSPTRTLGSIGASNHFALSQ